MKRYLPQSEIQRIKNIIDERLPRKTREALNRILKDCGSDFLSEQPKYRVDKYRQWLWGRFSSMEPEKYQEAQRRRAINFEATSENEINRWFNEFIDKNYKDEWLAIHINFDDIRSQISGIGGVCQKYNVAPVFLNEIFACEDIEKYLNERYSKKYVDAESLKKTELMKKKINEIFGDLSFDEWSFIVSNYQKNKDEILLNNMINHD